MRKHYLYITLSASLLAFTGCSDETDIAVSDANKQPIALTVGADAPISRAVVTDGTGKTLEAFGAATDIWMVMQSDYRALGTAETPNDLDFKGSQATTNCVTMGTTGDVTASGKENVVNFTAENTRYWDDAHARSSALSIWAVAVPNVTGSKWGTKAAKAWNTTTEDKTISWEVPATQTAESMKNKDLCFSNNITEVSEGNDKRLGFKKDPRGFEAGKLIFYHALTKITVKLEEGEGFDHSSTSDFVLDNITLNGFKLSGTFDVADGEFASTATDATPITTMSQVSRTAEGMALEALVMPGTDLNGTLADAISFSVDKNAFKVSAATMKNKLVGGGETSFDKFEAGKNYIFTFTVNKTGIKLTATVAGWNDVTAETFAPKINISEVYGHQASEDECTDLQKGFDFYRSKTVSTGYTDKSTVSFADGAYTMSPQCYWPNHETHYFFRGVYPAGTAVEDSKISVSNAAYNNATSPSNLMLGYPRKTDGTTDEACKVHSGTLGICATEGDIRMNFQYVMSQVEVILISDPSAVEKEESAKVVLDGNTTVEILNGYKSGSILLENGTATYAEGDKGTYTFAGGTYADRHDIIIPQSLENLKFKITAKDSDDKYDSYEATISEIKVGGNTISAWEPGKKYVYTLNITKTGIKITATIKDWIEVKNDDPYHIWM